MEEVQQTKETCRKVRGKKRQMSVAKCLDRIFMTINRDGVKQKSIDGIAQELKTVQKRFSVSQDAAILLAGILERSGCHKMIDDEGFGIYLGCSNIEFISYHPFLRELCRANVVSFYSCQDGYKSYSVTPEALSAIESDGKFTPRKRTDLSPDEFFSLLRFEANALREERSDNDMFLGSIEELIASNLQLDYCRKVSELNLPHDVPPTERRIFYYLCHRYVSDGDQSVDIDTLMNLTGYMDDEDKLRRFISLEKTTLQRGHLIVFGIDDGFVDKDSLALSDDVKRELFNEVELPAAPETKHRDLVCCETIKAKDLFFNSREAEQIGRLDRLLSEDNFKGVQNRLNEMKMRKGFNILVWGPSGTGKTAMAYELARRTGRDIFRIDMSKLKGKYVGESERAIKGAFNLYRDMVNDHVKAPIMLFNECDAIFSKRLENPSGSVDQMMNAMQNIILDEMENIEGILIATTNLVANLDTAFQRRFIFKVKIDKPEAQVRKQIWKSMISSLSDNDAERLANAYDFSGGNIENVSRKSTIDYVLTGEKPTYESLVKYCKEENLNEKGGKQIGF